MSLEAPHLRVGATPPLRIVLVEDDEFDVAVFQRAFRQSGQPYEIIRCRRGEEVLAGLRDAELAFDLLVADHKLPGMPGFELCVELLKNDPPFALVLLTGGGSEQMAIRALRAGIHDYIVKDSSQRYLDLLPLVLPRVARRHRARHRSASRQVVERPDSMGMGLAECSQVVRRRGGKIWVEGSETKQPTLHFAVPLAPGEVAAWTSDGAAAHHETDVEEAAVLDMPRRDADITLTMLLPDNGRVRRILIAHPNPLVSFLASRFVERAGCRFVAVENGRQALEALAHEKFDVLMTGIDIPVLGGLEVTRHIRESEAETSHHLPIIALATDPATEEATNCLQSGMDAAVVRPIDFPSLSAALEKIARKR